MTARQKLATPQEVAEHLGVAVKTLWNWHSMHAGPAAIKVGGRLRYRMSDVDRWLEQRTRRVA